MTIADALPTDSETLVEYVGEVEHEGALVPSHPRQNERAVALPAAHSLAADPYVGVAAVPFDERGQTALAKYQDVPDEWIDIKPDGKLYLSHIHARNILNEAFGFGGWALVPVGEFNVERIPFTDRNGKDAERVNVYRVYRLYVNGRYVDEAPGAGTYYTNNADADYSDACEAAKSYALNRLCKTFNIAQKCWNKAFGEDFKKRYCFQDQKGNWKKKQTATGSVVGDAGKTFNGASVDVQAPPPIQPASSPADPSPSPDDDGATAKIRVVSVSDPRPNKKYGHVAYVKDENGREWSFLGAAPIKAAQFVSGKDFPIRVTYTMNGKYRNVTKVEDV